MVPVEYSTVLKNSILFRGMTAQEKDAVLEALPDRILQLEAGETYCMPGEVLPYVGVILKGKILISKILDTGNENLIQKLSPGYLVGADIACTASQNNPFYIYAEQDCIIWTIPVKELMGINQKNSMLGSKVMQNLILFLANENIRKQYKVDVLSHGGLRDRIISYLLSRSGKLGRKEFTIPFNREEMANYLCVNRSALSHELSLMREEGLIDFHKDYFVIKRLTD